MAKKQFNPAAFWAKQIGLAIVLIVGAAFLINSQNEKIEAEKKAPPEKNINRNLSDFYAAHRNANTEPIKEEQGDFVLDVKQEKMPLSRRLQMMEANQSAPVAERWVGEHKYRTFKEGSTLREAITAYAEREGMQVIWELDQDFIVKSQFQMDDTIVGSLYKIARAVDSSFSGDVMAYVCPKQRSLVITEARSDYLKENCTLARSSG
ncbi:MAG: TcpQ domain-containing protein [Aestuariibacter sp.]